MKKMIKEFKNFALKSNVFDLAVAVMLGNAMNAMVSSLVNDIIMPLIGVLMGGKDFSSLSVSVGGAAIQYGAFIQAVVNFFLIALCLFIAIKAVNTINQKMKEVSNKAGEDKDTKKEEKKETAEDYLKEIRDLLQKQSQ